MHLDLDRFGLDSSLKRSLPGEWHAAQKYAYVLVIRRHIYGGVGPDAVSLLLRP